MLQIILALVCIVFALLQIILFFKIWGMTNDIDSIRNLLERKLSEGNQKPISPNVKVSHKEEKHEENDIFVGDMVLRLSDNKEMKVDSVKDGKYFCKGSSIFDSYKYYDRNEIEKI